VATDPQSLLNAAKCFECYSSSNPEQLLELALLAITTRNANAMATTDPQGLFTLAKCYLCQGVSQFQALKLALLSQISKAKNAANDTTPAALMSQGKCFPCFSNADTGKIMELALLAQIANS
jgi:hypothetical protein